MGVLGRPALLCAHVIACLPALLAGEPPAEPGLSRPVVGIYPTIPTAEYLASYKDWVQRFGADAVILPAEGDADEVFNRLWPLPPDPITAPTERLGRLNGMLIPGGAGEVSPLARDLIALAVKANKAGKYWPVWGTCLGFEWLVQVFGGDAALQSGFDGVDSKGDVNLTETPAKNRILKYANSSVLRWLTHDNVTYEDHTSGVEPEHFAQSPGLSAEFEILASARDRRGRPYVAMMQGKSLPFYGVQFHPEKIRYVRNGDFFHNIPKTAQARCVSDDLAEFFVSEVRRGSADASAPIVV